MAAHSSPIATSASTPRPIIDIEAWTDDVNQTARILSATTLSPLPVRGTSVSLDIPLDQQSETQPEKPADQGTPSRTPKTAVHTVHRRREPIRRDSLHRREALLKGKEGSRRRQRWENDRLLCNPHAEPPLPSDWQIQPTYPVASVPYFLAPLWETEYKARAAVRRAEIESRRRRGSGGDEKLDMLHKRMAADGDEERLRQDAARKVPGLLRTKLKKARGAKGLLQDLEVRIREFMVDDSSAVVSDDEEVDSEDEIVFVGRDGGMVDGRSSGVSRRQTRISETKSEKLVREKLVFDSLAEDHGAAFGYAALPLLSTLVLILSQEMAGALHCDLLWS